MSNNYGLWIFTLNAGGIAAGGLWEYVRDKFQTVKEIADWSILREEVGAKNGKYHIQGVAKVRKPKGFNDLKEIWPEAHWEQKATQASEELVEYVDDSESNAEFEQKRGYAPRSLRHGNVPLPYTGKDVIKRTQLYPWQKELDDELLRKPNSRKIVWYYDPVGNNGKSAMLKYLIREHDVAFSAGGGTADIMCAIQEQINSSKTFVIDYPRFTDMDEDINYDLLEKLKDGIMTFTKYKSKNATFAPKHVVVFSNKEPLYEKMSSDRWDIRVLKNKVANHLNKFNTPQENNPNQENVPPEEEDSASNSDGSGITLGSKDTDELVDILASLDSEPPSDSSDSSDGNQPQFEIVDSSEDENETVLRPTNPDPLSDSSDMTEEEIRKYFKKRKLE
uniref:Replication-associated protein n=1 Tax=Grus japonensis CRESS-DNA-virus sp. TaxID=2815045 RepID=A0A8A4XCV9_9VIRU|nr:MAG: replication-associated protein [Grus japonensis CRESS-DNA-virus sp.]